VYQSKNGLPWTFRPAPDGPSVRIHVEEVGQGVLVQCSMAHSGREFTDQRIKDRHSSELERTDLSRILLPVKEQATLCPLEETRLQKAVSLI
jgi:hypothetical protein